MGASRFMHSRFLQLLLQSRTSKPCYIDTDNPQEWDIQVDLVKCKVKEFVVYLTHDTLTSLWCAGEIVTAMQMQPKVVVTLVRTGTFVPPEEAQLAHIGEYLGWGSTKLLEYGFSEEDVADAFQGFLTLPSIVPNSSLRGSHYFDSLATEILHSEVHC